MAYAVDKNFSSYIKLKSPTLIIVIAIYVHSITYRNDTVLEIHIIGQILQKYVFKVISELF